MLQFIIQVQGMSHIAMENFDYAKNIKMKYLHGETKQLTTKGQKGLS